MRAFIATKSADGWPTDAISGPFVAVPLTIGARQATHALVLARDVTAAPAGTDDLIDITDAVELDRRLNTNQLRYLANVLGVTEEQLRSRLDALPTARQVFRWLLGGEDNGPRQLQRRFDGVPITADDVRNWIAQGKPIVGHHVRVFRG